MLHSTLTASAKRQAFRARLASGELVRMPGAFNPLSAKLIEDKGFEGVYISGAVLSADLGLPDIGLTTLTEVAQRGGQIARVTDLPTLIDADTGFGEPMNVARTVQILEDAGVSGLHLEDQVNPKRCGHLDGKAVVDEQTALKRIRAAVEARRDPDFLIMARTDIRGVEGLDAAVDRAKALVDAGADAIFPEAMADLAEFEASPGLNVDLGTVAPGPLLSTSAEVAAALGALDTVAAEHAGAAKAFAETYATAQDGRAAERLVDWLLAAAERGSGGGGDVTEATIVLP